MTRISRTMTAVMVGALVACGPPQLNKVKAQLAPPASPVEFGKIPVLNVKEMEVPLLNQGRAVLNISNVTLGTADGIFAIKGDAPVTVASGNTENIVVTFTPTKEQSYTNTLSFETDDVDNPKIELQLTGEGSTRAIMEVSPAMIDFGRVPECSSAVQQFSITSKGTADLIVNEIAFTEGTSAGFAFVGSVKTPATVKTVGTNGLPGEIQITVKFSAPQNGEAAPTGGIRIRGTDPEHREVVIPLTATINKAPVAAIAPLGNGAPGLTMMLDGSGSTDADADAPLTYKWTLKSKPLQSTTTIAAADMVMASMRLDPAVPGAYEVQLDVTDAAGAKSCTPARATVVAAPAQKLLIELFWDNATTDLDLHVKKTPGSVLSAVPDDCFYQNKTPDWGMPGPMDDPALTRDALTGYGPEVFGYINPIDTTYRAVVVFANELLSANPASTATVRVYQYGVLKAEVSRPMAHAQDKWEAFDIKWPSGDVTVLP